MNSFRGRNQCGCKCSAANFNVKLECQRKAGWGISNAHILQFPQNLDLFFKNELGYNLLAF